MKREIRAATDKELPQDHTPLDFSLLSGDKVEYIITSGVFQGAARLWSSPEFG